MEGFNLCFLVQVLLFIGAAASASFVKVVLHASYWAAGISGFVFLLLAWFCYLLYQAKHPQWWPPWDEGLPQLMRMLNAFVPVTGLFLLAQFLVPTFQTIKEKAREKRMRTEQQHRQAVAPTVERHGQ